MGQTAPLLAGDVEVKGIWPAWSPTGDLVAFHDLTHSGISLVDGSGTLVTTLTASSASPPSWAVLP